MTEPVKHPILRTCSCFAGGRRRPPIRIHAVAARALLEQLTDVDAVRELVLADYRCPSCKDLVPLTVGDVLALEAVA